MQFFAIRLAFACIALVLLCISPMAQSGSSLLDIGRPVERELKGGESHHYAVDLAEGHFLRVRTIQNGIDVVVRLYDPSGGTIITVDSPNGKQGEEPLYFIAESKGNYNIEITSLENNALPGKYVTTLSDLRPATDDDLKLTGFFFGEQARSIFNSDAVKAREFAQRALKLSERSGVKENIAATSELIGNTYSMQGDLFTALEYHARVRAIREETNDSLGLAYNFHNHGIIYGMLGDYNTAIDYFNKGFDLMMKNGRKGDASVAMYDLGNVYRLRGDFARAMYYFQKSLDLAKEAKKPAFDTEINIAAAYRDQGNYEQAITFFNRARESFARRNVTFYLYQTLDGLGVTYFLMGDYTKAKEHFQQALELEEKMRSKPDIADTLRKLGDTYIKLGDPETAERFYQRALGIAEKQSAVSSILNVKTALARLKLTQRKTAVAVEVAEEAKRQFETIAGRGSNYELYDVLGDAYRTAGKHELAEEMYRAAIEDVEFERAKTVGKGLSQSGFYDRRIAPYRSLISLLISQGSTEAAFTVSEQARSRSIVEALQSAKVNVSGLMTAQERTQEQRLIAELATLNSRITNTRKLKNADPVDILKLEDSVGKKRLEFEDFRTRLYTAHPELRIERGEMNPISLAETSMIIPEPKTAVVEYVVTENEVFLFLISGKGPKVKPDIAVVPLKVGRSDIVKLIERFRLKLESGELGFGDLATELNELLLGPVADQLRGKANLVIVPDGPLWDLPFQALVDEKGKFLAEKMAVSYSPSLTALREMQKTAKLRKPAPSAELLAFGNPIVAKETTERVQRVFMSEKLEAIPEAARLVNELGRMYGPARSKVFTGSAAREETAKTEAPKYRIVQFATHGILNNVSPMYSHLVLAQDEKNPNEDGLLEAWEVKDLDLKADMVILSACDTARGRVSAGEGMIGMTWASFIAGAPTTVASQWKVDSASTTELMLEFHRQLLAKKRISKAEALRRASLKVMKMSGYKHPFYWAGFVMVGDGS